MEKQQTGGSHIGLLTPLDTMTQINAVDTIVCGKTILCFSASYLLWYWASECETNLNDGRPGFLEEGEQRGGEKKQGACERMLRTVLDEQTLTGFLSFFFCSGPCLSLSHSLSKYHYCTIRLLFIFRKDFIWAVVGLIRFLATVYTHPPSLPEEQNESRAAGQHSGFLHPDGRCERSQLGVPMLRPWSWVIYTLAKASKRQLRRKLLYIVW